MSSAWRRTARRALLAVSLAGLGVCLPGCGRTIRLDADPHAPRPADAPIELFVGAEPERPYERLAIVIEDSLVGAEGAALVDALKRRARGLGADALLLTVVGRHRARGATSEGRAGYAEGVAIRWR